MVPGTNAAGLPQFDELQRGIDEAWVRRTLQELIRIRSENPLDEPPGPGRGEQEIADYLCDLVSGMGVRVEQREAAPGRPNVYAYLPGRRGDFTLALAGHTDTVEAGDFPGAYDALWEDGKVHGRGACDMKAGLAANVAVRKALKDAGASLSGNLVLCFIADEEHGMIGARAIGRDGPRADQCIMSEPTELQVCLSSKGRIGATIIARGRSAHARTPEKGTNAISHMGQIIGRLDDYQAALQARDAHPLLGHASIVPGVIRGGEQANRVPDYCELEVDRRTVPGETPEAAFAELREWVGKAAFGRADFDYEVIPSGLVLPACDIAAGEPVVAALRSAHRALFRADGGVQAFPAGSDAGYLGFPTVICGPGSISHAHRPIEHVELSQVVTAARLFLHAALQLLG